MAANSFLDLPKYIYGTTRLGDETIPHEERVKLARHAIRSVGFLHTSHQYGEALSVIREALDDLRLASLNSIYKIGGNSVPEVRSQIELHLEALGIDQLTVGQLCPGADLADDLAAGGASIEKLQKLKEEGLVESFVMEVWPWTSRITMHIIANNHADDLIEGFIFYFNPLQRFVTNDLWDLMLKTNKPIIAMRTVAGGNVIATRDSDTAPAYLKLRAKTMADIFEQSGVNSWTEFAARFVFSFPQVRATVGSTAKFSNLTEFEKIKSYEHPLDGDIVKKIVNLQRKWSEEHDRLAEPWSM